MANIGGVPPGAIDAGRGGAGPQPLYGIFIRNNMLPKAQTDVSTTLGALRQTLNGGNLNSKQQAAANQALTDLSKALTDLGGTVPVMNTGGTFAPPVDAGRGGTGMQPLYGLFIRESLPQIRKNIEANIREISTALKKNGIPAPDIGDANNALTALKEADSALKGISNLKVQ